MPTSQPNLIEIFIEDIKLGHDADHAINEAGWPAAFEKAEFPYTHLALVSLTGRSQVWYATSYESHTALGDSYKRTSENKELAAELSRLSRTDAAHVDNVRIAHARARPEPRCVSQHRHSAVLGDHDLQAPWGEVYKASDTKRDRVNRGKRLGHTLTPVTIRRLWKGTAS